MRPDMNEDTARARLRDWTSGLADIQRRLPDFNVVRSKATLPHRGVKVTCRYQRELFKRVLGKDRLPWSAPACGSARSAPASVASASTPSTARA